VSFLVPFWLVPQSRSPEIAMKHNPLCQQILAPARFHGGRLLVLMLMSAGGAASAIAGPTTYSNPFSKYGQVENTDCGVGGICGAAEAENSFIFLSNYYKKVYSGTKLTAGSQTGNDAQAKAAKDFGVNGWTAGGTMYAGYYKRTGTATGDYSSTLADWFLSFAPGTSTISSFTNGTRGMVLLDDFLAPELKQHEDLELFIFTPDMKSGHVISPYSLTYDPTNPNGCPVCTIRYQDPNSPNKKQSAKVTVNSDGYLQFFDKSTFDANVIITAAFNVIITAAFSESPKHAVAEPAALAMLGGGLGLLGWFRRRGRQATA
jgi:hypothetical protein